MQLLLPKQPGGLLTLIELAHCTAPGTSVESADNGHGTNEKETQLSDILASFPSLVPRSFLHGFLSVSHTGNSEINLHAGTSSVQDPLFSQHG